MTSKKRFSFRSALYDNNADALFNLVVFSSFLVGAIVAGRFLLNDFTLFSIVLISIIAAHKTGIFGQIEEKKFSNNILLAFFLILQLILCGTFYRLTEDNAALIVLIVTLLICLMRPFLSCSTPLKVLSVCFLVCVEMSLLAVLGVYTQFADRIVFETALLGFIPALLVSSSLIARYVNVFEEAGWKRSYLHQKKNGKEVLRPGGISRLFATLLIVGPAICFALGTLGWLPQGFILVAIFSAQLPGGPKCYRV